MSDFYISFRDHPFKTSACLRGEGVKNLPNLSTDSTKKLPTVGGRGQKGEQDSQIWMPECDSFPRFSR